MQPEQSEKDSHRENIIGSVEWVRAQLDRMHADRLAGKYPEDRETILKRLGHGSYESYLLSPLWQRIRRRIFKRDNRACTRCSERATQVHHLTYTEPVLKGEDDAQLVSVCAECHDRIEFDADRNRRTDAEKQRVLEDRDGARQERITAEQARVQRDQLTERVRTAAGGRCFRCKGNTENEFWRNDGRVGAVPMGPGQAEDVWLCAACQADLDHDKQGRLRTDGEKLKLLRAKINVRYTSREPSLGFTFTKTFRRLNAMQREGIWNEYEWNCANLQRPKLRNSDPEKFELVQARYESTKANGRGRHKRNDT